MTTKEKKEKPKWFRWVMKGVICLVVLSGLIGGCSYINQRIGLKDDHILEEAAENYIRNETGLDIDLSHKTPE